MKKKWLSSLITFIFILLFTAPSLSSAESFEQVKQGMYKPLSPYVLNWSGDVLVNGGLNLYDMHYPTTAENADVVMTTSGDIGAKAIVELSPTHDLRTPIDLDSSTHQWKTNLKLKQTTYLIRTHKNEYAKIKVKEMLPTEVLFEYVIGTPIEQEEPSTNEEVPVKKWTTPPDIVLPDKMWTIKFSKAINDNTIQLNKVYVLSSKGVHVDARLELSNNGKELYVYPPTSKYVIGETYTLVISQSVMAKSTNEMLAQDIHMEFDVNAAEKPSSALDAPTGLIAKALNSKVILNWYELYDPNLIGYNIYMREESEKNFRKYSYLDGSMSDLPPSVEIDNLQNDVSYEFYVTAVNKKHIESKPSNIVSVTPTSSFTNGWGGTWSSGYGVIEFTQTGSTVTGTYGFGTLIGEIQGNVLIGTYFQKGYYYDEYGDFVFTLSKDGKSFQGKSRIDKGINWGTWNGSKLD